MTGFKDFVLVIFYVKKQPVHVFRSIALSNFPVIRIKRIEYLLISSATDLEIEIKGLNHPGVIDLSRFFFSVHVMIGKTYESFVEDTH